ncbi:hypothetical protein [Shewanella sp. 1180_01]
MDVEDNGEQFKESIYRIIELGLAHSAKDLIQFIEDLGKPNQSDSLHFER